jgi:hypothetical protein
MNPLNRLRNLLNRDKNREVFCRECGLKTPAEFFRCRHCQVWNRSPWVPAGAIALVLLSLLEMIIFSTKMIPTIADLYSGLGKRIPRLQLFQINFLHFFSQFDWLVLIITLPISVWLLFLWRPHRETGPRLVLTFAILLQVSVTLLFGMTLLDMVIWVPNALRN